MIFKNIGFRSIFSSIVGAFYGLFKLFAFLLFPIFLFFITLYLLYLGHLLYLRVFCHRHFKLRFFPYYFTYKKKRYVIDLPKPYTFKKDSFLKKIFFQFPQRLALDRFDDDPNRFRDYGISICVGEQGSGKTITACYLLQEWRKKYPRIKIYTNMCYEYEDDSLSSWTDLLIHNNGIYGVVNVVDEIQTWWSSADSKNVQPEMIAEICQQRKQVKATLGTVQVFGRLAKPFREQVKTVYIPKTFFGCLTVVFKSSPYYYDEKKNKFTKKDGFFFFVHTKKLRDSYDTYKKIEKYKDMEFSESLLFNYERGSSSHCEEDLSS